MEPYSSDVKWLVVAGFVLAFILAFAVGANDVANSFGTSVGSGTLTLTQACILATLCENAGAILIGQKVAATVRTEVIDVSLYDGTEKQLVLGCLAALASSSIFILVSTCLSLPVSSTQSIIGSTVGFTLVVHGTKGLGWNILAQTLISWIISPVLSGSLSILFFFVIYKCILVKRNPLRAGLRSLPVFYGITVFINIYSILLHGPKLLKLQNLKIGTVTYISLGCALGASFAAWLYVVPFQKEKILNEMILVTLNERIREKLKAREAAGKPPIVNTRKTFNPLNYFMRRSTMRNTEDNSPSSSNANPDLQSAEREKTADTVARANRTGSSKDDATAKLQLQQKISCKKAESVSMLFMFLQNLSACFTSFAHGSNDVPNAISPLASLLEIYRDGNAVKDDETPIVIFLYGGIAISLGLWVWGSRVINTLGHGLTKITPVTGFTASFCAALVIVVATNVGLPVSTTHCIGGSIVAVGLINGRLTRSEENATGCMDVEDYKVDWQLFRCMAYAWFFTVPASAMISALIMFCFLNYL